MFLLLSYSMPASLIYCRYDIVPEISKEEHIKEGVEAAKAWLGARMSGIGKGSVYAVNTGVGDRGTS